MMNTPIETSSLLESQARPGAEGSTGFDAFISYRRKDGSKVAQWLKRRLVNFKLPDVVVGRLGAKGQAIHRRRPRVFLDVGYEKSVHDFLKDKIFPALDAADRLIVIVTPSAFDRIALGDTSVDNWLVQEIERFVSINQQRGLDRPIDVVIGPGENGDRFPGALAKHLNWDWADLKTFRLGNTFIGSKHDGALTKLVAGLYEVPTELLPRLDAQERMRRIGIQAAIAGVVMLTVLAVLLTGLSIRLKNDDESRALAVQSANLLGTYPARALQTAIDATDKAQTPEAVAALRAVLLAAPLRVLPATGESTPHLAFVNDGRLAAGDGQGRIVLTDTESGQQEILYDHPTEGAIDALAASLPSATVAWSQGKTLYVMKLTTRTRLTFLIPAKAERIAFDTRGTRVAVAFEQVLHDKSAPTVPVWIDLSISQPVTMPMALPGADRIAWSLDGMRMVLGKYFEPESTIVWDILKQQAQRLPANQGFGVNELAFGSNQRVIGTGSNRAYFWDLTKNVVTELPHTIGPSDEPWRVTALAISPNHKRFATFGDDRTVRLWDASNGNLIASLSPMSTVAGGVHFSDDSFFTLAHASDGTARIWDDTTLAEVSNFANRPATYPDDPAKHSAATGNLSTVAVASTDGRISIWHPPGMPRWRLDHLEPFGTVAFNGSEGEVIASHEGSLASIDIQTGRVMKKYAAPVFAKTSTYAGFDSIHTSPSSGVIVLRHDCQLAVWSDPSTAPLLIQASQPVSVDHCIHSPYIIDPQHITAFVDGKEWCWQKNGNAWMRLNNACAGLAPEVLVKWGVANRFQFKIGKDKKKLLIERSTQAVIHTFDATMPYGTISADGKYMAISGSGSGVQVIELYGKRKMTTLVGHNEGPIDPVFSPDSRWMLTAGYDGTIVLWEVGTWRRVTQFYAKYGAGYSYPRFSPTGQRIAVFRSKGIDEQWGTPDGAVLVYDCEVCKPDADLIGLAKRRLQANLK